MCKVDVYPFLNPDGTQGSRRERTKCEVARRGDECRERQVFRHALQGTQLPPSPLSTPRSSTPNYRSGDESGGSSGSRRRRSGVYIEVNGRPVYHETERRRRPNPERVVVVESPPTARTPPRESFMPRTAPPSPSPLDSRPRGLGIRPVIVDERVRPSVVINTVAPEYVGHRRTPSNSSHRSRGSSTSDDAGRWDPFATSAPRRAAGPTQAEVERERMARRIAAANAEINSRPAVPMPPTPPQRTASTYVRPAVEVRSILRRPDIDSDRFAPLPPRRRLVDPNTIKHPDPIIERALREDAALNNRRVREGEERERQRLEEEEAQRQRLRERMTPQRRATVTGSGRRTRVVYPDGVYRVE